MESLRGWIQDNMSKDWSRIIEVVIVVFIQGDSLVLGRKWLVGVVS